MGVEQQDVIRVERISSGSEIYRLRPLSGGTLPLLAYRQAVNVRGAKTVHESPLIVANDYGRGKALFVAALPGLAYLHDAERAAGGPPSKRPKESYNLAAFSQNIRRIINQPVSWTDIEKPVQISTPVVEVGLREKAEGIVVVLVNYTRKPTELNVRVRKVGKARSVESYEKGPLRHVAVPDGSVSFVLPLDLVDMVLIRPLVQ